MLTLSRDGTTRYWDFALTGVESQYRDVTVSSSVAPAVHRAQLFRPAVQELTYDTDGNLTSDDVWVYQWDAENRLTQMTNTGAQAWGMPARTLSFAYDYLGRRVQKQVVDNGVTGTRKYIYHGWNLIAELDPAFVVARSYVWGLDLKGSLTMAGGVGALVLSVTHTSASLAAHHAAYDANGNLTALVKAGNGALVAVYEYDPYGQFLRKTGSEADANSFRFSTKFTDQETGLVYYGYRHYDPGIGRFISRDVIGEAGGANLYAFVGNNPVDRWDYLGKWWLTDWLKKKFFSPHVGAQNDSDSQDDVEADDAESSNDDKAQGDQEGRQTNASDNNRWTEKPADEGPYLKNEIQTKSGNVTVNIRVVFNRADPGDTLPVSETKLKSTTGGTTIIDVTRIDVKVGKSDRVNNWDAKSVVVDLTVYVTWNNRHLKDGAVQRFIQYAEYQHYADYAGSIDDLAGRLRDRTESSHFGTEPQANAHFNRTTKNQVAFWIQERHKVTQLHDAPGAPHHGEGPKIEVPRDFKTFEP